MKKTMKRDSLEAVLIQTDDAFARLGTLGVIGGCLLALASLMF
jgi:hypothetical protein